MIVKELESRKKICEFLQNYGLILNKKNTNNTEKIILFKIIIDEINYNFPKIFESKISNKEDFSYLINFFKDYSNSNKKYQTVFEKIFNNKNKIKVLDNIKSYFFNNLVP